MRRNTSSFYNWATGSSEAVFNDIQVGNNQLFNPWFGMSQWNKVYGTDTELLPESEWQTINGVVYKYKVKELDQTAIVAPNTLTIDQFKTQIADKNKIYTHDDNGQPILWNLQDIMNTAKDTEPLNKLFANNLRFNDIINWNGSWYEIIEHFFNQPMFLNTVTYRWGVNGDFSLGKIITEFFSGNNDINGTNIFIDSTIPVSKLTTLQTDRFVVPDNNGHLTTLVSPIPSQLDAL